MKTCARILQYSLKGIWHRRTCKLAYKKKASNYTPFLSITEIFIRAVRKHRAKQQHIASVTLQVELFGAKGQFWMKKTFLLSVTLQNILSPFSHIERLLDDFHIVRGLWKKGKYVEWGKDLGSKVMVTQNSSGAFLGENGTEKESSNFLHSDKSQRSEKGL